MLDTNCMYENIFMRLRETITKLTRGAIISGKVLVLYKSKQIKNNLLIKLKNT